jgi:hypothetical protein
MRVEQSDVCQNPPPGAGREGEGDATKNKGEAPVNGPLMAMRHGEEKPARSASPDSLVGAPLNDSSPWEATRLDDGEE